MRFHETLEKFNEQMVLLINAIKVQHYMGKILFIQIPPITVIFFTLKIFPIIIKI